MTPSNDAWVPLPDEIALLLGSELFDPAAYAEAAGLAGLPPGELAMHYLTIGEPQNLSPSERFEPRFYLTSNSDVRSTAVSPLLHYLRHGARENRYPSRARLRADAQYIEESGLFDARAFVRNRSRPGTVGLSPSEDYLIGRDRVAIGDAFDTEAYASWYSAELNGYPVPLLHFLDVGLAQTRVATLAELQHRCYAVGPRFNVPFYLAQLPPGEEPRDPVEHYILHGSRRGYDPEPGFAADYYMRRYPDMAGAGMDVYLHYVSFGLAEGRVGRPDFLDVSAAGGLTFDPDKPTLLLACHEASRTGAPLVGLNVGTQLAATHNVIFYLPRGGSLLDEFKAQCCLLVCATVDSLDAEYLLLALKESHTLGAVLLNSVETSPLAAAALYAGLPSVALIHEFAEYTLPAGRMSRVIETTDRIVAPAELIRQSMLAELARTRSGLATNIRVRPQGCLPSLPKDAVDTDLTREQILALVGAEAATPIVLGAGYAQIRKGVDLFVQTAAVMRGLMPGVRFIWVGDGYDPARDITYSAWVADMVRRLALEDTVFFLPSQGSLDLLFELSSVFYLPSRLDPFPNVVLDAFQAGRAVVCFADATGAAALLGPGAEAVGAAVPYCSVPDAAQALAAAVRPEAVAHALSNREVAATVFAFDAYMADLRAELVTATESHAAITADVARIVAGDRFDPGFFGQEAAPASLSLLRRAVTDYVAQGRKGLMQCSPRPGFNEGLARAITHAGPALAQTSAPATTHRCVILADEPVIRPFPGRAALHLHLHYPELAGDFLEALVTARSTADLFVTTTSDEKGLEIAYALRKYRGGRVLMTVVPNRGRDIGPFLTEIGQHVRAGGYDVVGHLHGKRSLSTDAAMGDRWRDFLVGTLLGGRAGMAAVLAPFTREPALGLLFAEDRHVVGWSGNRAAAERLAERMVPPPILPDWPVFPIGTMFWARPAALEALWRLGLTVTDFPHEPAAYDGTVLHALERMLPSVAVAAGFEWATVHRPGTGW